MILLKSLKSKNSKIYVPVITNILPQQKNKDRFSIYIDDVYAFGLMSDTLGRLGLAVGQVLSESELNKMQEEVVADRVLLKAITLLSYRPRSKYELQTTLKQKFSDVSIETIQDVLMYLENKRYIDDVAFAEWWVQQRREVGSRYGTFRIQQELRRKGIEQNTIDDALRTSFREVNESDNALKVGVKVWRTVKGKDDFHKKQKFLQSLVRKGFSWENAQRVYDTLTKTGGSS